MSILLDMLKGQDESLWRQWAPLPLRPMIGYGFMAHGWAKLSRGPVGFAKLLDQIGAPLPEATDWVSTLIEILGGLAILAGTFVAVVSVPLIVMMLVAMFIVHLRYGFSAIITIGLTADGPQFGPLGYEVNLLYIAALVALILGGAGPFSIDRPHEESDRRRPHHPDCLPNGIITPPPSGLNDVVPRLVRPEFLVVIEIVAAKA